MTEATDLLERCRALGATLTVNESRLHVRAPVPLPDDLIAKLRYLKQQVLSELSREQQTTSNCWVLEEWRRISIPEWRRILNESIDSGNKKREEYARWMLSEVLEDDEIQE